MDKNHLLAIYKVEADKYNKTRDIHWKMNIAIWTILIVAIYAKIQNKFDLKICLCVQILFSVLYLALHLAFIIFIHRSLHRSLKRMHDMATILLQSEPSNIQWETIGRNAPEVNSYWEILQVGITVFLFLIFFAISN